MVRRLSLSLIAALLAVGVAPVSQAQRGFGFGGGFGGGMGKVVTGEPYTASATSTSTETLANGTTISHTSTIMEARDAEGRTVRAVTTPPTGTSTQGFTRTTVMDPVAHTITEWSTQSTTATQFQLPVNPRGNGWAGADATPPGPRPDGTGGRFHAQVTRVTLTPQAIAGVNAEGVRTTRTIAAGAEGNDKPLVSTREVWTSSDLKIVLLEKSDDPRDGSHKTEVTALTPGEPNATLFQVPQGYTVKAPTRHRGGN